MPWRIAGPLRFALLQARTIALFLIVQLRLGSPVQAALESDVYHTVPGANVVETGEGVINGSRVVPFSATVTLTLEGEMPSLSAVIHNAVLEGGAPFNLPVRSSFGARLADGTFTFRGDYLREIRPLPTQYLFDWKFSSANDGAVLWNGLTGWAGGHIWQVTLSDIALVPEPEVGALILLGAATLSAAHLARRKGEFLPRP